MTYNEALKERDLKGKTFVDGDAKILVLIVPNKNEDKERFLLQFDVENYNDEDCVPFSSDYKYKFYKMRIDNN